MTEINRLQRILFLVSLGFLPFNLRYILNFERISSIEGFREHLSLSIFVFDLPLFVLAVLIAIEAYRLFRYSMHIDRRTFEMRPYSITREHFRKLLKKPVAYFFIILGISTLFSGNLLASLYNSYRLVLAAALFLVTVFLFKKHHFLMRDSSLVLFCIGIFQSMISLFQILLQKSLGLAVLGESVISAKIPGVAKFDFAGEKFIRAYGTFPHPNMLGFFLIFALGCGLYLITNGLYKKKRFANVLLPLGLLVILIGIMLTYSRTIILSSFILILIVGFLNKDKVLKAYNSFFDKLHINVLFRGAITLLFFFAALFMSYNLLAPRMCIKICDESSYELRTLYNKASHAFIAEKPFWGVGPGNFVLTLKQKYENQFEPWEFQPTHNLYLLIASEIGLVGLVMFLVIIINAAFKAAPRLSSLKRNPFIFLFALSLFVGFFDHYLWTLAQGQMFFWLSLAFFRVSGRIIK